MGGRTVGQIGEGASFKNSVQFFGSGMIRGRELTQSDHLLKRARLISQLRGGLFQECSTNGHPVLAV